MNDPNFLFDLLSLSTNYLLVLASVITLISLPKIPDRFFSIRLLLVILLTIVTGYLIKHFFYWPRPYILNQYDPIIGYLLDGSFPSNHTAYAFVLAFMVFRRRIRTGLVLLGICYFIALGRIVGGVHTLVDTIGGIALGLFWAILVDSYHSK